AAHVEGHAVERLPVPERTPQVGDGDRRRAAAHAWSHAKATSTIGRCSSDARRRRRAAASLLLRANETAAATNTIPAASAAAKYVRPANPSGNAASDTTSTSIACTTACRAVDASPP